MEQWQNHSDRILKASRPELLLLPSSQFLPGSHYPAHQLPTTQGSLDPAWEILPPEPKDSEKEGQSLGLKPHLITERKIESWMSDFF